MLCFLCKDVIFLVAFLLFSFFVFFNSCEVERIVFISLQLTFTCIQSKPKTPGGKPPLPLH